MIRDVIKYGIKPENMHFNVIKINVKMSNITENKYSK